MGVDERDRRDTPQLHTRHRRRSHVLSRRRFAAAARPPGQRVTAWHAHAFPAVFPAAPAPLPRRRFSPPPFLSLFLFRRCINVGCTGAAAAASVDFMHADVHPAECGVLKRIETCVSLTWRSSSHFIYFFFFFALQTARSRSSPQ